MRLRMSSSCGSFECAAEACESALDVLAGGGFVDAEDEPDAFLAGAASPEVERLYLAWCAYLACDFPFVG
jgi:hypothetical protein